MPRFFSEHWTTYEQPYLRRSFKMKHRLPRPMEPKLLQSANRITQCLTYSMKLLL